MIHEICNRHSRDEVNTVVRTAYVTAQNIVQKNDMTLKDLQFAKQTIAGTIIITPHPRAYTLLDDITTIVANEQSSLTRGEIAEIVSWMVNASIDRIRKDNSTNTDTKTINKYDPESTYIEIAGESISHDLWMQVIEAKQYPL